ncbi:c-type cytochrome biogenesis protein CcsB [Geodermatophilus poikilotrophus]|uniref:Cytochrome c-type biogenesis protein CcsB n=1 Tax=Geodermatophilus poikilotrophus TaxID=1333667 RepID=A0A1I0HDP0_9ACTN|nr:c-type cytochrome biogenesis protein CcsB [Geodermatophilus poikilotrophus]SET81962.1 cytochrome c-type biogenesis protein CcsB [Geodermatophilus poikilotrophus]
MTVDPSLAELSDRLFSIAVALYSVAVVAFSAQLAFGRRPARELVPAGSGGADAGAPAAPLRSDRWGLAGLAVTVLGAAAHAGVLITRGMAADRLPWGNMYEFATAVVLVGVVAYLVLATRVPAVRDIGAFVLAPVVISLVAIGLFLYTETGPLVAALRSSWLAVHVSSAILGSGLFFVSGIASVLYLLRSRQEAGADGSFLSRLPGAATLDRVAHRTAVFAFPIYTFAMIAGAIWAESAWGRFWGWDPKETWMFISWVVYAGYLHARTTVGWRGRPAAWVNVVGFAVVLFNLLYVNMVSTGLHSYGGLD